MVYQFEPSGDKYPQRQLGDRSGPTYNKTRFVCLMPPVATGGYFRSGLFGSESGSDPFHEAGSEPSPGFRRGYSQKKLHRLLSRLDLKYPPATAWGYFI
jgi:hypothetical protein